MDRLTSLMVFTRVVDRGEFSATAQRLNMSTTMVSNHVQALENQLGVRLLNRTTRRVSLTDVGREYYERCNQILADLEEADEAAERRAGDPARAAPSPLRHPHRAFRRARYCRFPGRQSRGLDRPADR
ncbi:MAG: LysR family transcriptional regulator [Thiohalocapsa sp.]